MIKIFAYGDSNTWGYYPTLNSYDGNDYNTKRFNLNEIWWSYLDNNEVIFNGVNGRTINNDHPDLPNRNAMKTIQDDLVDTNIDLTIIMLGTNDLKDCYKLTVDDIINNLEKLINVFKEKYQSKIMLLCPPLILDTIVTHEKYTNGIEKIKEYERKLSRYCVDNNYLFTSAVSCEVGVDGEHLTKDGHKRLGLIVNNRIKKEL